MSRSTLRRLESEGIMKEVEEQKRSKGVVKAIDRTRFNNRQMDLISKPSWS